MTRFQNAEVNFNLKNNIHDKKGGIGRANAVEQVEESERYENHSYDINKMDM